MVVESEEAFSVGDIVTISGGGNSETRGIVSFGSIVLDAPLGYGYPAGSRITRQDGSSSSNASVVGEQQDSQTSIAFIAGAVIIAAFIALACCGAAMAYRMRRKSLGSGKIAAVEHGCADGRLGRSTDDVKNAGGGDDEEAPASEPLGSTGGKVSPSTSVSTDTISEVRPHGHGSTGTSASCESVGSGQGPSQLGTSSRASDDEKEADDEDQGAPALPGTVEPDVHHL